MKNQRAFAAILFVLLLSSIDTSAQARGQRFFGTDTSFTFFTDVVVADNQDIVACGLHSPPQSVSQPIIFRMDPAGNVIWSKEYVNPGMTNFKSICNAKGGGFYVAGMVDTTLGWGDEDGFIMKIDEMGNRVWWTAVGGPTFEHLNFVTETDSGTLIATGQYRDQTGDNRFWYVKMDTAGTLIQSFSYFPASTGEGFVVRPHPDGGYVIGGMGRVNFIDEAIVFKIGAAGALEWFFSYGETSGSEALHDLRILSDKSIVFTGTSWQADRQLFIGKIDSIGGLLWFKNYNGPEADESWEIMGHPAGGFIVAGFTEGLGSGPSTGPMIMKTDDNGDMEWVHVYPDTFPDDQVSIDVTNSGEYVMVGSIFISQGSSNGTFIRTDSAGINCDYNLVALPITVTTVTRDTPVVNATQANYNNYPLFPTVNALSIGDSTACMECDSAVSAFSFSSNEFAFTFTNTSSNGISYEWDFGDNSAVSNMPSPGHTYATEGSYEVCLIVDNGCSQDTSCQSVSAVGTDPGQQPLNVELYPNPAGDLITISMRNDQFGKGELQIMTSIGTSVLSQNLPKDSGNLFVILTLAV